MVQNFSSGVLKYYLVFTSANRYINFFKNTHEIYSWKSKGKSEESIKNPPGLDNTVDQSLINSYLLPDVKLGGNCLMNSNISVLRKVVNLYISYKLDTWSRGLNTDFTLGNCLFGPMNLT